MVEVILLMANLSEAPLEEMDKTDLRGSYHDCFLEIFFLCLGHNQCIPSLMPHFSSLTIGKGQSLLKCLAGLKVFNTM